MGGAVRSDQGPLEMMQEQLLLRVTRAPGRLLAAFRVECVFLCVAFLALTSGPPYEARTDGLRTGK